MHSVKCESMQKNTPKQIYNKKCVCIRTKLYYYYICFESHCEALWNFSMFVLKVWI